ncbi:hypothetical protein GCM10009717_18190 [Agromyces allii]|uniref:Uncharacterized protein n=1 Tax=Agromyces allii TaxID=393607 RepID=A0ABN2QHJ2_9MICO
MQSSLIAMAIEYLIMRERRSASGEGGRLVIDCCFINVVAVRCGAPLPQAYVSCAAAAFPESRSAPAPTERMPRAGAVRTRRGMPASLC